MQGDSSPSFSDYKQLVPYCNRPDRFVGIAVKATCLPELYLDPHMVISVSSLHRVHRKQTRGQQKAVFEWVATEPKERRVEILESGQWLVFDRLLAIETSRIRFPIGRSGNFIEQEILLASKFGRKDSLIWSSVFDVGRMIIAWNWVGVLSHS